MEIGFSLIISRNLNISYIHRCMAATFHHISTVPGSGAVVQRAIVGLRCWSVYVLVQRSLVHAGDALSEAGARVQSHAEVEHWVHATVEIGHAFRHRVPDFYHKVLTVHHLYQQEAVVRRPAQEKRYDEGG